MAGILGPLFAPLPGPARAKPTRLIDYLVQNYQPGQPAPQTISAAHVPMRDKLEQGIASALDYVMPKGKAEERAAKIVNLLDLGAPINPVAAYDSAYDSGKAYAQGRPWASAGNMGLAALAAGGFGGGLKVTGNELAKGIRAYHGSPHDFERFSLDKIGTGEGAQAYGHGLYFAEKPAVAEDYRNSLAAPSLNGRPMRVPENEAWAEYITKGKDLDAALRSVEDNVARHRAAGTHPYALREHEERLGVLRAWKKHGLPEFGSEGKMYEVNINADPASLLDWDAPLSGQSDPIRKALNEAWLPHPVDHAQQTGAQIYDAIARDYAQRSGQIYGASSGQAPASEAIQKIGIPGIKYLDQGSRSAGEGSRNYVIFDDKLIDILRKYGLAAGAVGLSSLLAAHSQPAQAETR